MLPCHLCVFSPQVLQAVCTLLGIVMPRVPNGVLRAKWLGAANLISSVLTSHKDNVSGLVAGSMNKAASISYYLQHAP
jgi:hypothetical protein